MTDYYILGKIDFKNAFNRLNREQILKVTFQHNPALLEYTKTAYSAPSSLFYGDHIMSETGAQQGDPEGPPLFCDGIRHIVQIITSELNICHLDDGIFAGEYRIVFKELKVLIREAEKIGLSVNLSKCEIVLMTSLLLSASVSWTS